MLRFARSFGVPWTSSWLRRNVAVGPRPLADCAFTWYSRDHKASYPRPSFLIQDMSSRYCRVPDPLVSICSPGPTLQPSSYCLGARSLTFRAMRYPVTVPPPGAPHVRVKTSPERVTARFVGAAGGAV